MKVIAKAVEGQERPGHKYLKRTKNREGNWTYQYKVTGARKGEHGREEAAAKTKRFGEKVQTAIFHEGKEGKPDQIDVDGKYYADTGEEVGLPEEKTGHIFRAKDGSEKIWGNDMIYTGPADQVEPRGGSEKAGKPTSDVGKMIDELVTSSLKAGRSPEELQKHLEHAEDRWKDHPDIVKDIQSVRAKIPTSKEKGSKGQGTILATIPERGGYTTVIIDLGGLYIQRMLNPDGSVLVDNRMGFGELSSMLNKSYHEHIGTLSDLMDFCKKYDKKGTDPESYKHFQGHVQAAREQMSRMNDLLAGHAKEFKAGPTWTHVGDMGHVKEILSDVDNFLGGEPSWEPTGKKPPVKAEDAYVDKKNAVNHYISGINRKIEKMEKDASAKKNDWGNAGSMEHVRELIEEINNFLGE